MVCSPGITQQQFLKIDEASKNRKKIGEKNEFQFSQTETNGSLSRNDQQEFLKIEKVTKNQDREKAMEKKEF